MIEAENLNQPLQDSTQSVHLEKPNHIHLEQFSGPLDLLLQLIRDQEMDICKIDISKITHQYVEYIKTISTPNLENASDFIRMAAMLMYIKSKTLLPKDEMEEEDSDLKKNLVRLLVNYQKYQIAGNLLFKKDILGRGTWKTAHKLNIKTISTSEVEINKDKASFLLIQAFSKMMQGETIKKPHKTREQLPSLLDRVRDLTSVFIQGAKTSFNKLIFINKHEYSKLLTFLSLLELSKLGFVSMYQKALWADIEVEVKKNIDESGFILLNNEEKDWLSPLENDESKN